MYTIGLYYSEGRCLERLCSSIVREESSQFDTMSLQSSVFLYFAFVIHKWDHLQRSLQYRRHFFQSNVYTDDAETDRMPEQQVRRFTEVFWSWIEFRSSAYFAEPPCQSSACALYDYRVNQEYPKPIYLFPNFQTYDEFFDIKFPPFTQVDLICPEFENFYTFSIGT